MAILWHDFHAITMQQGQYQIIHDAMMLTEHGKIQWLGERATANPQQWPLAEQRSLAGAWVTPGFIDCHTHLVFAGDRSGEFEQRLQGMSYAQIAAAGGGIARTVQATRQAESEQLLTLALSRAKRLLSEGVTTLEVKSGYGLTLASERKLLMVIKQLANHLPLTVRATCLAAHAIPAEYQANGDGYIDDLCQIWLPQLAAAGLIDAVDAFCETIAFSPAQVEKLFITAKQLNLPVKLHAEQLSNLHGSGLAARYQALSADHLEYLTEQDISAMAKAGTIAVLLPAAFYTLREKQLPPIALLRKHQVKMAIATDLNPGTSPMLAPRLLLNMACTLFQLTPEEALAGLTLHAAQALGLAKDYGSLAVGKQADFLVWQIEQPAELAYWIGGEPPKQVVKAGQVVDFSQLTLPNSNK